MTDMIYVNDFVFCEAHGAEWCPSYCGVDYRLVNNVRIEDEVGLDPDSEAYHDHDAFNLDYRRSFNAYELGAVLHIPAKDSAEAQYSCRLHRTDDCPTCFNWVAMIKEEIEEVAKDTQWLDRRKKWLDRVDP